MDRPVIRVAIADDQKIVRSALRGYLQRVPGIICVGEAANAEEAVQLVRTCQVNVLVLDLRMPGSQEMEALRQVRAASPETCVVVLSAYPAERYASDAILAGAKAYLEKAKGQPDRIVQAIQAAVLPS